MTHRRRSHVVAKAIQATNSILVVTAVRMQLPQHRFNLNGRPVSILFVRHGDCLGFSCVLC